MQQEEKDEIRIVGKENCGRSEVIVIYFHYYSYYVVFICFFFIIQLFLRESYSFQSHVSAFTEEKRIKRKFQRAAKFAKG